MTLEIKFDKKGLHSAEEGIMKRRKGDALTLTGTKFLFVSALFGVFILDMISKTVIHLQVARISVENIRSPH